MKTVATVNPTEDCLQRPAAKCEESGLFKFNYSPIIQQAFKVNRQSKDINKNHKHRNLSDPNTRVFEFVERIMGRQQSLQKSTAEENGRLINEFYTKNYDLE